MLALPQRAGRGRRWAARASAFRGNRSLETFDRHSGRGAKLPCAGVSLHLLRFSAERLGYFADAEANVKSFISMR